jgi:hydrogenase nickel incorporation protein HypA/HybF
MHELAVTQSILNIALRHANLSNAKKVTRLNLVIGQLSSIIDDSVQFYWDMVAANTLAEGAELAFRRIPTEFTCQECQSSFATKQDTFSCPKCSSSHIKITAGEEFFLESIEVEN